MYKPEGFATVFPYCLVKNADAFIAFLKEAFDAEETGRTTGEDGSVLNAIMRIGDTSIMLSEARQEYPSMPGSYYIFVKNADETYKKALACGAHALFAPMDMPYGDRQGGVKDSFGNLWWISTRLVNEPYKS